MILVTAKRQEFAVNESVDAGLDPFDERESRLRRPTCQERREGQEQLLDQPSRGERAECVRTSFEQDQLMAALAKRTQNDTRINLNLRRQRCDLSSFRNPTVESRRAAC